MGLNQDSRMVLLQKAFPGLSSTHAEELLNHVHESIYAADTVLCREGVREGTFYLIVDGQVAITKWIEFADENRFLRHGERGDFFGEMALVTDSPRGATVTTTRQTTVLEMSRERFLHVISTVPSVALAMVKITMDRMRANDRMQFEELREAYEALQKLDRAKLDFIEVAAHELRTPLTVVQGYAKVMDLSIHDQDDPMSEALAGLQEGVTRMLSVVNAMLDVSKIDSQMLKVSPVPVLPKLVAGEALHTFKEALQERDITVEQHHEVSDRLPYVYADPALINKLFYQLISNAIKYTPNGGTVTIITRETYDSRVGHGLEVIINDSGVGISPEHMRNIFQKFYQGGDVSLHSSSKTAFMGGGPGLGLAIVAGIVKAHKGYIWAESDGYHPEQPSGSTFHVLLPAGDNK